MTDTKRKIILITALVVIVLSIVYFESIKPKKINNREDEIPLNINTTGNSTSSAPNTSANHLQKAQAEKGGKYPRAKELRESGGFINTDKISIGELIGKKVILLDFWTYSCINCQRTIPYLNSWYDKYHDKGLEIIGVHTPEFQFEHDYNNVKSAVEKFKIKYPVVLDNDYGTWSAYDNQYWPREYLIDIDGYIVHDHIGEGNYDETEKRIQDVLQERMNVLDMKDNVDKNISNPSGVINFNPDMVASPETYFGAARNVYLGNGTAGLPGEQGFSLPDTVLTNTLYLDGKWNIQNEYAENKESGDKIIFKYNSKNVYFVAGANQAVKIKILRDGKPPGMEAGRDVSADGTLIIKENRLYNLIEGKDYSEHTLEIIIQNPGLQAFTFTFG